MTGASGQLLVIRDLIATHVLVAAVTVVHTGVLPDMNPDLSLAGLEITELAFLSFMYCPFHFNSL